jgi:hypothetical protein
MSLLRGIPSDDFNGLPSTVFKAIWIVATGQDVESW